MERILNWRPSPYDPRDFQSNRHTKMAAERLPTSYKMPINIPVYDQGGIGSCTANSGCVCFLYECAEQNFSFEPSRLFLYWVTRFLENSVPYDDGAYIRDVFKALRQFGLAKEQFMPYIVHKFAEQPSKEAFEDGLNHLAIEYAAVKKEERIIKQTLMAGGAISFGFYVYESFMKGNWSYTTGLMPMPAKGEQITGGHAVTIVGWDDDIECFLIQNSWGTDWGKEGFFWMPYKFLLSANCSDFWVINKVKLRVPQPAPPIDFIFVLGMLFETKAQLNRNTIPVLVKMASLIGIEVATTIKINIVNKIWSKIKHHGN